MKVICIFDFIISPLCTAKGDIKYGEVYTVIGERKGYSTFGQREVDAYELAEVDGLYEKGIFIPIDENKFDTVLKKVLSVPKMPKKYLQIKNKNI
jgi:hypothetical protein